MVSRKLIVAVKLSTLKGYQIAHQAGLHPATLSKIICGIERVKLGDTRVIAVGRVLGLSPAKCFSEGERVRK